MDIAPEFIDLLVCPATHQPVSPADASVVERLNGEIESGTLRDAGGDPVTEKLDGGLVRKDGTLLFPVIDGIPVMLTERAIQLG